MVSPLYPDFRNLATDWETMPVRTFLRIEKEEVGQRWADTQLLSLTKRGVIARDIDSGVGKYPASFEGYQYVEPGDLVFCLFDVEETPRTIGLVKNRGMITSAYTRARLDLSKIDPRYAEYLFVSLDDEKRFRPFYNGLRNTIQKETFRSTRLSIPLLEEQRQIAGFLDRETAKIDALIAKQEQLITTLDERRNRLLRILVTRGKRKDVELKSASSAWLVGELIPSHWMELPISRLLDLRSGTGITSESIDDDGEYPVFGGGGVRGFTDTFTNEGDFVLIGRQGGAGLITRVSGRFFASEHAIVCYPLVTLDLDWSAAVLEVMDLGQYSQSSAQPGISVDRIRRVRLPAPPLAEQREIGQIIREEGASMRFLSSKAAKSIELLSERRQALISSAVTGKMEVSV